MITFTDKGAEKVQEFLSTQAAVADTAGLRVGVRGGGCSGFQYALAFDEQRDGDERRRHQKCDQEQDERRPWPPGLLLALLLLTESRRPARIREDGSIVLLADQDRSLWDRALIGEGQALDPDAFKALVRAAVALNTSKRRA